MKSRGKAKKGVALVIALFVVLVMLILSGGITFLVRNSINEVSEKRLKTKLFYAAEAGLNHGLRKLRMSDVTSFSSGSVSNLNGHILNIDGMTVTLNASHQALTGWTLSATASMGASTRSVRNTLTGIRSAGMCANAVALASNMNKDLEFASSTTSDPGALLSSQDMIIGNQYFGGLLNMDGIPTFDGVVNSASRSKSKRENESGNSWTNDNGENMTDVLRRIEAARYYNGIWDKSDGKTYKEDDVKMTSRFADVFPSGYNGNQDEVDFLNNVVEPFTTIEIMSNTILLPSTATYKTAEVTVNDKEVKIKYNTGSTQTINITSSRNIIAFPKNFQTVTFNECAIGTDMSFVMESANAVVKGDLYYKGTETGVDDMGKAWAVDRDNIDELQNSIGVLTQKLGVITYTGSVTIDASVGDTAAKITGDQLMLNGAFYCPRGSFGANSSTNAKNFKGSKRVVNVGSIMMDTKGLYRSGSYGITAVLSGDPRFVMGIRPLGYKQLVVLNESDGQYYVILSDDMAWTSEWL